MLYLIIFLWMIVCSWFYDYKEHKIGKYICYISILVALVLVAGLAYRVGIDSTRYEDEFRYIPKLSELAYFDMSTTRYAPGYMLMLSGLRSITSDFMIVRFVIAIFVNTVVFWFFNKYTTKIFLALVLYFMFLYFTYVFEVIRESCAVAFFLLAWPHFKNDDWIKYYIFAFLSAMFHTSGIIMLLIPLLYLPGIRSFFMIGRRTVYILLAVYIIGMIVRVSMFDMLQTLTFLESVSERAKAYSETDLSTGIFSFMGIVTTGLKFIIYPYIAMCLIKKKSRLMHEQNASFDPHLQFMICICLIMATLSIPIGLFYRYNNYFFPFAIIVICNIVYTPIPIKGYLYRMNFFKWMIALFPLFFIQLYGYVKVYNDQGMQEIQRYYPYTSRLNPVKDDNREKLFRFYNHAWKRKLRRAK